MREFRRPHHQLVWQVLESMDRTFLAEVKCWFAGGTRIALEIDEYRESIDVDFLCASTAGYRAIRSTVTSATFGPLFRHQPELLRDIRTDRYGVRAWLTVDNHPLKLEIVLEGRTAIGGVHDDDFPVAVLDHQSCLVEKLLANSDRGRDASTQSRDLIDLAFMVSSWNDINAQAALATTESAYGDSIRRDLRYALDRFADTVVRRRALEALAITNEEPLDHGLSRLDRLLAGTHD